MSLNICSIFLLDFQSATFLKTADGEKMPRCPFSSWAVLGQPAGPRPRPERFEVLTKHLVRLGDIAWQQGIDTWKPKLEEHICVKNKGVEHKVLIRVTHVEG